MAINKKQKCKNQYLVYLVKENRKFHMELCEINQYWEVSGYFSLFSFWGTVSSLFFSLCTLDQVGHSKIWWPFVAWCLSEVSWRDAQQPLAYGEQPSMLWRRQLAHQVSSLFPLCHGGGAALWTASAYRNVTCPGLLTASSHAPKCQAPRGHTMPCKAARCCGWMSGSILYPRAGHLVFLTASSLGHSVGLKDSCLALSSEFMYFSRPPCHITAHLCKGGGCV